MKSCAKNIRLGRLRSRKFREHCAQASVDKRLIPRFDLFPPFFFLISCPLGLGNLSTPNVLSVLRNRNPVCLSFNDWGDVQILLWTSRIICYDELMASCC